MARSNATNGRGALDATCPETNRVAVRLPAFIPSEPALWFAMAERSLEASGVTTETAKFAHILGALDPKHAIEVKDIITSPPTLQPYTTLKQELTKRLSVSQEEKTRRLLEHEVMGDQKPSQFLRHLRDLGGAAVNDGIIRTLWLGRLPTSVQAILATQKDAALDKVAELADAIVEVNRPGPPQVAEAQVDVEALINIKMAQLAVTLRQELVAAIQEVSMPGANRSRPQQWDSRARPRTRSRPRSRSRRRSDVEGSVCYYHWRFGAAAKKCEAPCSFAGNAAGNR